MGGRDTGGHRGESPLRQNQIREVKVMGRAEDETFHLCLRRLETRLEI